MTALSQIEFGFLALALGAALVNAVSSLTLQHTLISTRIVTPLVGRLVSAIVFAFFAWVVLYIALLAMVPAGSFLPPPTSWLLALAIAVAGSTAVVLMAGARRQFRRGFLPLICLLHGSVFALLHEFTLAPQLLGDFTLTRLGYMVPAALTCALATYPGLALRVSPRQPARLLLYAALFGLGPLLPFWLITALQLDPTMLSAELMPSRLLTEGWLLASLLLALFSGHALLWLIAWGGLVRASEGRTRLQRLNASLAALLDDTPDWVGVVDQQGRLLTHVFGAAAGHVHARLGEELAEHLQPELAQVLREQLASIASQPSAREQTELRLPPEQVDGPDQVYQLALVNRLDDPEIGGVVVTLRSMTELRADQAAAAESRALARIIFENAPLAMLVADGDGDRIIDINPALEQLYGHSRETILAMGGAGLVAPEDQELLKRYKAELDADGGTPVEVYATHVRADGTRFPVRAIGTRYQDTGRPLRITMIEDITGRMHEQALQRGENALLRELVKHRDLEQFLESVLDWLQSMVSASGWLVDAQVGGGQHLRASRESAAVTFPRTMQAVPETLLERLGERSTAVSLAPEDWPDGPGCTLLARAITDRAGAAVGVVAVAGVGATPALDSMLDLASGLLSIAVERDSNDLLLRHAQRMEAVGRITGGIAHDFNNVLTVILGNLDLLSLSQHLTDEDRETLGIIEQSTQRAAEVTRQLLSLSRRRRTHVEPLDLVELVPTVRALLDGVLGERIELKLNVAANLSHAWAEVDRAQLESSLLNLAVNARDALQQRGRVRLTLAHDHRRVETVTRVGRLPPGDYWVLAMADDGPGMTREQLARVLDPFYTTKAEIGGTGLGLAQVANFASDTGGGLELDSQPGQGTVVRLLFPAVDASAAVRNPRTAAPDAAAARVLLVEDEPLVAVFARRVLEGAGHSVVTEGTADAARLRLEHGEQFDLVVSDIGLPGEMDGVDLLDWLQERRPGVRVLLTSGYAAERLGGRSAELLLPKPYDSRALLGRVAELLTQPRTGTGP